MLHSAWSLLGQVQGIETVRISRFYETEPVGGPSQPLYLNAVGILNAGLEPQELLDVLLCIENQLGRVRCEHWGARTIDLDLLLFDSRVIHTETLMIPHPRMTERLFILEPAAEITPDWIHPVVKKTIDFLYHDLKNGNRLKTVRNS